MKRSVILPILAIVLLALFCGQALLLLLVVFPLVWFFIRQRENNDGAQCDGLTTYQSVDQVTACYGQPDDVVELDAARANELAALVLFYPRQDVVIAAGSELKLSELKSVAPKNMATPYTVDEWAVILSTRNRLRPTITLRVGYDAGLASEIAGQIGAHIKV